MDLYKNARARSIRYFVNHLKLDRAMYQCTLACCNEHHVLLVDHLSGTGKDWLLSYLHFKLHTNWERVQPYVVHLLTKKAQLI